MSVEQATDNSVTKIPRTVIYF